MEMYFLCLFIPVDPFEMLLTGPLNSVNKFGAKVAGGWMFVCACIRGEALFVYECVCARVYSCLTPGP